MGQKPHCNLGLWGRTQQETYIDIEQGSHIYSLSEFVHWKYFRENDYIKWYYIHAIKCIKRDSFGPSHIRIA